MHLGAGKQSLVNSSFELNGSSAPFALVRGNQHLTTCIYNTIAKRNSTKSGKNHTVSGQLAFTVCVVSYL